MRIAFFGGSFDPPHRGHLRIATVAAERLHLNRILLAPVALQPLKRESNAPAPASYADRLAMLRLLLADDLCPPAPMEVSALDAPRADGRPNYTYDTLLHLRAGLLAQGEENKLFMLLGADSFLSMRHWYRAPELLLLADWIVAARPGFHLSELSQAFPPGFHPIATPEGHAGCIVRQIAGNDGRSTALYLLPDLHEDISATAIRAAFAEGAEAQPIDQQVLAPSVIAYIRSHGLYR